MASATSRSCHSLDPSGVRDLDPSADASIRLFTSALKTFKESLPEEDRRELLDFQDPQSMIQTIRLQVDQAPEKRRLLSCCNKVDYFAKKWEPFFKIIDIFVSSHPEWSALAWGAVRLVFKLTSHYATFFEKLAEMFERIAQRLPHYQRHISFFQTRGHVSSNQALLKALAHVYTDIIEFCQEACKIFSTKRRGVRYKMHLIKDLFWTPFDIRFGNLLQRLSKHNELYELELSLRDRNELERHYERAETEIEAAQHFRQAQSEARLAEAERFLRQRVREIRAWINAPDYAATFEKEKANITDGTGRWLLREPTYARWRDAPTHSTQTFASRVLTIFGKPGYGKTVLSTLVIEDLTETIPLVKDINCSSTSVAYFHFDKMSVTYTDSQHALRAVLAQIIHRNKNDTDLFDTASVLMESDGTGQLVASEAEIASILSLAVERSQNLTLVFDGLDECGEPLKFLQKLYSISAKSSCKIVIFSRPNIQLAQPFLEGRNHIHLSPTANLSDITSYLGPEVDALFKSGLLTPAFSAAEVIDKISTRANSLFLWVRLMLSYLQCPALTPREREDAILHLNLLEGLDAMYCKILEVIRKRLQPERRTVFRVFQWLAVAYRPLQLSELRVALAIRLHKSSIPEQDYIVGFAQSLVTICGALVELRDDGSVQFIHLSVNEYLTSTSTMSQLFGPKELQIDLPSAHLVLAAHSLSYMLYDLPQSPLSGSGKITAEKPYLLEKYPLLAYSLEWWRHAADGLFSSRKDMSKPLENAGKSFIVLAREFLANKSAVTTWIEAFWTISESPDLRQLCQLLQCKEDQVSVPIHSKDVQGNLDELARLLRRLSDDLVYLVQEWKHILKHQPNQVWEPSINMFRESQFLIGTNVARISWIAPDHSTHLTRSSTIDTDALTQPNNPKEMHTINLASQVSTDGLRLASVILIRPKDFVEMEDEMYIGSEAVLEDRNSVDGLDGSESDAYFENDSDDDDDDITRSDMHSRLAIMNAHSSGWKARYRLWALNDSQSNLLELEIDLPEKQIFNMLLASLHLMEPRKLRIPVSFSADLQSFTILQSVVRISDGVCAIQNFDDLLISTFHGHIRSNPSLLQTSQLDLTGIVWYHTAFSRTTQFLAVVRSGPAASNESGDSSYYNCSVAIYKDLSNGTGLSNYQLVAIQGPFDGLGGVSKILVFHPNNAMLATVRDDKTYTWKFQETTLPKISLTGVLDEEPDHMIEIYDSPLDDLSFSPCGKYLWGSCVHCEMEPVILPIHITKSNDVATKETVDTALMRRGGSFAMNHIGSSICAELPAIQSSNDMIITTSRNGILQSSVIKQSNADSAVLLSSRQEDGTLSVAELFHLPKSGAIGSSFTTLLNPLDKKGEGSIRVVLNKGVENTYCLEEDSRLVLPMVLERKRNTIITSTTRGRLRWINDNADEKEIKRRKIE